MSDVEEHFEPFRVPTLVVAFAGGPQNRFQFGRVLKDLGVPHVLLKDSTQQHYDNGILGLTKKGLCRYIASLKGRGNFDYIILTGVSSGAYAALMYGILVSSHVNEVIVISPITGRSKSTAFDFPERYRDQIIDPKQPHLDLKPLYRGKAMPCVRAFISDGAGCELDRGMCDRIGITDITVVPGYSHGDLARGMRDLGMFKELFS